MLEYFAVILHLLSIQDVDYTPSGWSWLRVSPTHAILALASHRSSLYDHLHRWKHWIVFYQEYWRTLEEAKDK